MPCALVLPLKLLNTAPPPEAVNDCAHAAFFALIDSVDALLAQRLHGIEERKLFTLCLLYKDEGKGYVEASSKFWQYSASSPMSRCVKL